MGKIQIIKSFNSQDLKEQKKKTEMASLLWCWPEISILLTWCFYLGWEIEEEGQGKKRGEEKEGEEEAYFR